MPILTFGLGKVLFTLKIINKLIFSYFSTLYSQQKHQQNLQNINLDFCMLWDKLKLNKGLIILIRSSDYKPSVDWDRCFCWLYLIQAYQLSCLVDNVLNVAWRKTMLTSLSVLYNCCFMLACLKRLQIDDCKFFSCDWLTNFNRNETWVNTEGLWSDKRIGLIWTLC